MKKRIKTREKKVLINLFLLLLAIPVGFLISWMAKEELKQGRRWFRILVIAGILGGIGFWIYGFIIESLTMFFICIVALVSLVKS